MISAVSVMVSPFFKVISVGVSVKVSIAAFLVTVTFTTLRAPDVDTAVTRQVPLPMSAIFNPPPTAKITPPLMTISPQFPLDWPPMPAPPELPWAVMLPPLMVILPGVTP